MKPGTNAQQTAEPSHNSPYLVVGSGKLVSFVFKEGDEQQGWQFGFNVFRMDRETGAVSQHFRPTDVEALAKLTRLLAAELVHDGCLPSDLSDDLACLASCLDDVFGASTVAPAEPRAGAGHRTKP